VAGAAMMEAASRCLAKKACCTGSSPPSMPARSATCWGRWRWPVSWVGPNTPPGWRC
jgi:hypothetical protein